MTSKTRILASVLCLLIAIVCIFGLASCGKCAHKWGEWTVKSAASCTVDGVEERACTLCGESETRALAAAGHKGGNATCTAPAVCLECDAEYAEALGHDWLALPGGSLEATCTTDGFSTYKCSRCGESKTETFAASGHSYGVTVVAPTCTESGGTVHTCSACGDSYTDEPTSAMGHSWSDTSDCIDGRTCTACGESEGGSGHSYESTVTEPTCSDGGYTTHTCSACGDSYVDSETPARGHVNTDAKTSERKVDGETCKFEVIYECDACGETAVENTVYHHNYKALITTSATCTNDGVKTLTCSSCSDSYTEPIEKNENGHLWQTKSTSGVKRVDECTICFATKSVTVVEGNVTPSTNASDLKDTEIEMSDASLSLGDGVIDKVAGKDVVISADKLTGTDRPTEWLDKDQLEQIGDSPVFNFTMSDGEGLVEKFGEGNWVTITVPYDETMGDVDNIAIWFIAKDGTLETIPATYNNGYVTFKTNHFSYYTVTRLTPKERCTLYGHNYVSSVIEPTCTEGGYTFTVCIRCTDSFKSNELPALGHSYVTETTEPTCTESGISTSVCSLCQHTSFTILPAKGHDWTLVKKTEASCVAPGAEEYACSGCDLTNRRTYPQLPHTLVKSTVAPTCTEVGYDLFDCSGCDYYYTNNETPAIGHDLAPSFSWADDFSRATLNLTCRNDGAHVFTVEAEVTNRNVDDAELAKIEHTARAVYNGETYTDVKIEVLGDHTHDYSYTVGFNADYHWLECICGDKKNVTEHEWTNGDILTAPTCSDDGVCETVCQCGAKGVSTVPATGEHDYVDGICSVCGGEKRSDFYINLVSAAKKYDSLSFEIEELAYYQTRKGTLYGSLTMLDGIRIEISEKDGELYLSGSGKISIYNGPIEGETVTNSFDLLIEDGIAYATTKIYTDSKTVDEQWIVMPLEVMGNEIGEEFDDAPTALITVAEMLPSILGELSRVTDAITAEHTEAVNGILESTFNIFFTAEATDGGYTVTLDAEKIDAFINNLKDMKITELVDHYYGEGAAESIKSAALELGALKLGELGEYLAGLGVSEELFYEVADSICDMIGAPDAFSLKDAIEEYKDLTVAELGEDNPLTAESVEALFKMLSEHSVFELLGIDPTKIHVDTVAMTLLESFKLSLDTDKDGNLLGARVSLAEINESFAPGVDVNLAFSSYIKMGDESKLDMSALKTDALSKIVNSPDIEPGQVRVLFADNSHDRTFVLDGVEYTVQYGVTIGLRRFDSATPVGDIVSSDCTNWLRHDAYFSAGRATFQILYLDDVNNEGAITGVLVNVSTGEAIRFSPDEGGIRVFYPDGTNEFFEASNEHSYTYILPAVFKMDEDDWGEKVYTVAGFYHNSVSNEYAGNSQHEYETTLELEGTDCTEGCIRTTTCKKCGDFDSYIYNSHASKDGPSNSIYLDSFGICSGEISYKECIACDAYSYVNADFYACNFSRSIQGDWTVYTCRDCGVIYSRKVVNGAKDEDCYRTIYVYYSIVKDGVTVFEGYTSEYREMHDYDYSYELLGESCYDGVIETTVCRDCGYTREDHYEYHRTIYTDPLEGVSCCIDHYADIGKCACGKEHRYVFSSDLEHEVTEDGEIYFCDACGVRILISLEVSEKDCVRTEKRDIITTLSGKTVFTGSISFEYTHHDIALKARKTEGGAVITEYCRDCGASTELNYVTVELEKHGYEYYYDLYFTPERDGEYMLISIDGRDTKATLYKLVGTTLEELEYDDDSGPGSNFRIAYELYAGETYVYRISFYNRENSGSIAYAMLDSAWEEYCDHSAESICDGVLFEGAADCMGGAVYYVVCPSCMEPLVLNVVSDHEPVFEHDDIDLTDSGCDGYIQRESCVCGKNDRHEIFNLCYDNYTENEYFDENGNLVFVRTFSCSECTRRYEISSYFEYDRAACATITYYTVVISNNSGYSNKFTYSEVNATHDYEYDFTFDGDSKNCYDGVTVNMTCTVCGNKDSEHVEYHVEYLKERIDLKSIGSVCGGYADIYSCPCGAETFVDLEHSLCDTDHRYIDPWTDDYVSGYHYHTEGYDHYSYDFEEFRCSVTDPAERACTFTIRTAHYWHRDPKTCSATFRTEILIGYDPATGRAAYTYTHDSDSVQQVHDYDDRYFDKDVDGRNGYRGVCRDCGGHYDYYDYVSGNETVYVDSRTNNAKNGFNKSSYEESRYVYFNGSNQCTYDYYKTVDANGVETWEKSVTELELIVPPFGSDAFSRKTSTTYSSGESSYREEEITYYKGYSYMLLGYVEKVDGSWYREEYSYSFENGCLCTLTYTDSNGERHTESYSAHRTSWDVIKNPTCTQPGIEGDFCRVCDDIVYSYPVEPIRHSWTYVDGHYVCRYCMLENANGATGDITLEDLSGLLGGDTDYVIGYYAETGVSFVYNVSIILKNGTDEQIILDGISFSEHDTYCAIVFSKAEVKAAAAALGYSADQYDVRFAFVPIGGDGSFDYAITLTEGYPPLPDVVNGVGTYTAWIGETGYAEFTLRFEEGGDYRITSLSYGDTFIEVYRDGELAFENDDGSDGANFAFYYCAEANSELVIRVKFLSGYEGCFPVVIEAMPW